jgi:hypothetical protein
MKLTRASSVVAALLVSAISVLPATAQNLSKQIPLRAGDGRYPPIGVAARVAGDVVLRLSVGTDGHVHETSVVSGPTLLQGSAIDATKQLTFATGSAFTRETTVHFRLSVPADGYTDEDEQPGSKVVLEDDGNVTITHNGFGDKSKSHCPTGSAVLLPAKASESDYVELVRAGFDSSYKLRISADGAVTWNPNLSEEGAHDPRIKTTNIHPEAARALLEEFRNSSYWAACKNYSKNQTDSGSDGLTVGFGGQVKLVDEYADAAPDFIHDLEYRVDEVADSHRWRVGDPKDEIMPDIDSDVWLPKPGRTRLMALGAEGKPEEMELALAHGDKVTDIDSSGWTPLMYAASGNGVKFLLGKGADPNARGPKGETALMFSALTATIDEDLIAAGADVNAATSEGVTALMLLAQRGDKDEIATLLKAGADAKAKDAKGRTALDYLLAASCGNKIVDERYHWMTLGYGACTAIDADGLKASRLVLERAGARQTRVWYPKKIE